MRSGRYRTAGLPYDEAIARSYDALDLPYGAPMPAVTRRWRSYLRKCHPDFHRRDPDMLADAYKLTRILTEAHEIIREAWERYLNRRPNQQDSFLPYSEDLARAYDALDLPFSAPMDQVTRRWKSYLKKCHPDLHASHPQMAAEANKLTRILTEAHQVIREAWDSFTR